MRSHEYWMSQALTLADRASLEDEVPIGAVIVLDDELIAEGWNQTIGSNDPTAHAEIVAIRRAAERLENYRLVNTRLYVTIEPCTMCAGALVHSRIAMLIYGAKEPRAGAIDSSMRVLANPNLNHQPEVLGGICADEAGDKMSRFFKARRVKTT